MKGSIPFEPVVLGKVARNLALMDYPLSFLGAMVFFSLIIFLAVLFLLARSHLLFPGLPSDCLNDKVETEFS